MEVVYYIKCLIKDFLSDEYTLEVDEMVCSLKINEDELIYRYNDDEVVDQLISYDPEE